MTPSRPARRRARWRRDHDVAGELAQPGGHGFDVLVAHRREDGDAVPCADQLTRARHHRGHPRRVVRAVDEDRRLTVDPVHPSPPAHGRTTAEDGGCVDVGGDAGDPERVADRDRGGDIGDLECSAKWGVHRDGLSIERGVDYDTAHPD
jgi:hypothetical protein